jgi:acyl-CoA hydrolase
VTPAFAAIADGLTAPRTAPDPVAGLVNLIGWLPVPPPWASTIEGVSLMGSPGLTEAFSSGRLRYAPVRYSALPRLLGGALRPSVAIISARPYGHGFRFGGSVGYALAAAAAADSVEIEVDESLPDMDAPDVPGPVPDRVTQAESAAPDAPTYDLTDLDLKIGGAMADLIPESATVQYGPGAIGEACVQSLSVPVRVHSGIVTEGVVELARRGLLVGTATAAYMYGGAGLAEMARSRLIRLRGVGETHAAAALAGLRNFVALNTALQVGLDGSVNVERIGQRQIAGIGGHADFSHAAAESDGGLSVIGLRSVRGSASTIVPRVDVVSTARTDVDVVVTEWGTADLRGRDDASRSRAIIEVADPHYRDELEASLRQR